MTIYNTGFNIELKSDNSPLTTADKSAHNIIQNILETTKIPVLSEEGDDIPYCIRKNWSLLWIFDPLDGTKEFLKHNDEFTINICLIKEQKPILGVVYCPPLHAIYFASYEMKGAFKSEIIDDATVNISELIANARKLPFSKCSKFFTVVASRSHLNNETLNYISALQIEHKVVKLISKGSSLKFCLVAEGLADVYPRFAATCEWDTAAAQAIVEFSGGKVINASTDIPLTYNKESLLNPSFIVTRK